MSGLIGRKIGMTSLFNEKGKNYLYGIRSRAMCGASQNQSVDGYDALQLGFDTRQKKEPPMPPKGISKKQYCS